jgi:hypothetical protein
MDRDKANLLERRIDSVGRVVGVAISIGCLISLVLLGFGIAPGEDWWKATEAFAGILCFSYLTYKFVRWLNRRDEPPRDQPPPSL